MPRKRIVFKLAVSFSLCDKLIFRLNENRREFILHVRNELFKTKILNMSANVKNYKEKTNLCLKLYQSVKKENKHFFASLKRTEDGFLSKVNNSSFYELTFFSVLFICKSISMTSWQRVEIKKQLKE